MPTKSVRCSDAKIVELWAQSQASPHTQACYRRDSARLVAYMRKPLARITLGDLHSFAQPLVAEGLAPISRARTIAATKSLFGSCMVRKLDPHEDAIFRYCGSPVAIMGFEYAESARSIPIFADRRLRVDEPPPTAGH